MYNSGFGRISYTFCLRRNTQHSVHVHFQGSDSTGWTWFDFGFVRKNASHPPKQKKNIPNKTTKPGRTGSIPNPVHFPHRVLLGTLQIVFQKRICHFSISFYSRSFSKKKENNFLFFRKWEQY